MPDIAAYSADERLRDGRRLAIRALQPEDKDALIAAVGRTSSQALYRRFFGAKRDFTESEIAFFVNIDFVNHVALVAEAEEGGRPVIVGGGRYFVLPEDRAEVAFVVVDENQGQGIGKTLLRHLAAIAREAGLKELVAEVLPENASMLKVFEKSGLPMTTRREARVVHVVLQLQAPQAAGRSKP